MTTLLDAVTEILCKDVRECLADYEVSGEAVSGDVEFRASMQSTADYILLVVAAHNLREAE
jgi:hypothetical protein